MKKERQNILLALLELNKGQLDWLPKNPRQWTQTDIDRTADSIREDEDFLEDRPLLVTPNGKKWIVFAGNLRRTAAKAAGLSQLPCVVYYPEGEDDQETIKRRSLKDNGSFGSWDYDLLANEWDDLPLGDWGVPSWGGDVVDEDAVDALFEDAEGGGHDDTIKMMVQIPKDYENKKEDILAALKVTLEEWPGCSVK